MGLRTAVGVGDVEVYKGAGADDSGRIGGKRRKD